MTNKNSSKRVISLELEQTIRESILNMKGMDVDTYTQRLVRGGLTSGLVIESTKLDDVIFYLTKGVRFKEDEIVVEYQESISRMIGEDVVRIKCKLDLEYRVDKSIVIDSTKNEVEHFFSNIFNTLDTSKFIR
jgi:hypothetical protein